MHARTHTHAHTHTHTHTDIHTHTLTHSHKYTHTLYARTHLHFMVQKPVTAVKQKLCKNVGITEHVGFGARLDR